MAIPVRGFGGSIGFVPEVTWGTAVSPRTHWVRCNEVGLQRKIMNRDVETLGVHGATSTGYTHRFIEREEAGGRIVWPAAYQDGTQSLFHHMLGATAESGAGPFVHTQTPSSPGPVGLTIAQIKGTHASLSTQQTFEGCRISSLELSIEAGGMLMCAADIIAQTGSTLEAVATPTYGTPNYVLHNHLATSLTLNSVTYQIKGFTLRINRNLQRNYEMGSLFTSEPFESRLTYELDVDLLWQTNTLQGMHLQGDQHDITFSFTGTGNNAMAFQFHNAILVDHADPTTSPEGVRQTAAFRAYSDGSSQQGVSIITTNDNALYTAN
jgi:hypothetical protein